MTITQSQNLRGSLFDAIKFYGLDRCGIYVAIMMVSEHFLALEIP